MGYYTRYRLGASKKGVPTTRKEIIEAFRKVNSNEYEGFETWVEDLIDGSSEETKWYEHEDEMRKVSKLLPGVILVLDGEGEGDGDIDVWKKYFKDGKMQADYAKLIFKGYDETKLK